MRAVIACLISMGALACQAPKRPTSTYPVHVHAHSDDGAPLAEVGVSADGRLLGATDAQGTLLVELTGSEGQRVELRATCPERYEPSQDKPIVTLRRFASLEQDHDQRTRVELRCVASERTHVIAVRAGQADVPVLLRGEPVARTGTSGTAHVVLRERAGASVQLTLDTATMPDLRPASPTRMFAVPGRDDFVVWDQPFERAAKPKKRAKPKPTEPEPAQRHVPYRLN